MFVNKYLFLMDHTTTIHGDLMIAADTNNNLSEQEEIILFVGVISNSFSDDDDVHIKTNENQFRIISDLKTFEFCLEIFST